MGIFATRSPNRPNPLGLSCVKLESSEKTDTHGYIINVSGIDMADGTPIYDIKPYLPHTESIADARGGFAADAALHSLSVSAPEELLMRLPVGKRDALIHVLEEDPRPSYQNDPEREYGFPYAGFEVKFKVDGSLLTVTNIEKAR